MRAKVTEVDTLLRKLQTFERRSGERPRLSEPPEKFEGPAHWEVDDWVKLFEEGSQEREEDDEEPQEEERDA